MTAANCATRPTLSGPVLLRVLNAVLDLDDVYPRPDPTGAVDRVAVCFSADSMAIFTAEELGEQRLVDLRAFVMGRRP